MPPDEVTPAVAATGGGRARRRRFRGYRPKLTYRRLRSQVMLLPRLVDVETRMLPTLIILGAQKAGTSSLFRYLSQHPQVRPPIEKEVHFFDLNMAKGLRWYQAHFPRRRHAGANGPGAPEMTLDASPYYLFHPAVAERMKAVLPQAKFAVMLRNPVDRAYSHYWHEYERGYEHLPLAAALAAERDRLRGEADKLCADARYRSRAHQHHSYLSRGLYAQQIKRWYQHFPPERFLFIKSEDFFADPEAETSRALRFLDLAPSRDIRYRAANVGHYRAMDARLRETLDEFYRPFNHALLELVGRDFAW